MGDSASIQAQLDAYYQEVKTVILDRQNPVTGLLPASTAVTEHGDYRDAWVRDNVYSILAVWGLALAYRKLDDDAGRQFELDHAVIKLMRGLLAAMMKQASKVEAFKLSQHPSDALHAKYNTATGDTVVADHAWGHLQLDATSLYLLMLAQMISSGLTIIYSLDEVDFIQNLVFYIGRTYQTPDYGIWERGDKTNHGEPELNASSIAMAKAALEALSGFDLFGVRGSQASVIHVLPDEIARARTTLEALLPRESSSKEIDAALLSSIAYPAFAIDDEELENETREKILSKLSGRYGLKRFLRDGHQTVIEDPHRLHYEPSELKQFEDIESQWPLFFTYLILDGLFKRDQAMVTHYLEKLEDVMVEQNGHRLIPELYFVPNHKLKAERKAPNSQERQANTNVPLVWAQSLYILGQLVHDQLIDISDIDPLGRHRHLAAPSKPVIQLALIAEDENLQKELASRGIQAQTPKDINPIGLGTATDLTHAYHQIGNNPALMLTGRPLRRLLSLSTSRIFQLNGAYMICLPGFLDRREFYLSLDPKLLTIRFKGELAYIQRHWSLLGRPTVSFLLSHNLFAAGQDVLLSLLHEFQSGSCAGIRVKLAPLRLLMQGATITRLDHLKNLSFTSPYLQDHISTPYLAYELKASVPLKQNEELSLELETDQDVLTARLKASRNLFEQVELLASLFNLQGGNYLVDNSHSVHSLLEEVYTHAATARLWAVVRQAAALLEKVDAAVSESVTDLLVSQKSIVIGKSYTERSLITRPLPQTELLELIKEFCREDIRDRVLTQEILIYLGLLIKAEPNLFEGFFTIRVGHLILLLTSELAQERVLTQDEAYNQLLHLPPSDIQHRLRNVLLSYIELNDVLKQQESIQSEQPLDGLVWSSESSLITPDTTPSETWWRWRQRQGVLSYVPNNFYQNVWKLMEHCKGIIIGDKLERRNRLESQSILSEMTPGEKNFALRIEHLLHKIVSPEYRQISTETLMTLYTLSEQNPELMIDDYLVLDIIIGHAVRLSFIKRNPKRFSEYGRNKTIAWDKFYELSPQQTSSYLIEALKYLLEYDEGKSAVPN